MTIYYLINKASRAIISKGELPETWENITGLTASSAADLKWAKRPDFGFLTKEAAIALCFTEAELNASCQGDTDDKSALVRIERNKLLQECDWTQLADAPLNPTEKATWLTYRQSLRDLTTQAGFPWEVTFPAKP
jgi:hypothetical protein